MRAILAAALSPCSDLPFNYLVPAFLPMHRNVPLVQHSPFSPNRLALSVAAAGILVHHDVLVSTVAVFLRSRRRHVSGHTRHQHLGVLPLGRGPVGRVAGLLCEGMAGFLAEVCGLLRVVGGKTVCADVCLPCWRGVAGFGQALFRRSELGLELLELGGFGCEGLLSVRVLADCWSEVSGIESRNLLLLQSLGDVARGKGLCTGRTHRGIAGGQTKHAIQVCGEGLRDGADIRVSQWNLDDDKSLFLTIPVVCRPT